MLIALIMSLSLGQAEQEFNAFFEEFAAKRNAVKYLEADFVQRTVTPDETIVSGGTITYANPRRLLFHYQDPEQVYILDGLRIYEYDAELRQMQVFDLENRPETSAFFLGFEDDAGRLREAYEVRLIMPGAADEGPAIELRPKDEETKYFERVTLHLRQEDYLPETIHIINSEESEVFIRVENYVFKDQPDPARVRFTLPEGTDVIENDNYISRTGAAGLTVPPLERESDQPEN